MRENSLCVINLARPARRQLLWLHRRSRPILNGKVDWVYEEEMETRSNYFWSPDSKFLAYLQMDETDVPQYPIEDWMPTHAQVDSQRYPQPGTQTRMCTWA